jgi:hypothetical protein
VKKSRTTIFVLFGILGALLLVYFYSTTTEEKHYQWHESYADNDQPYGTMFIKKLLQTYRPGQKFIINNKKPLSELLDSTETRTETDYIFIGQSINLSNDDAEALAAFIYSGHDAFISSIDAPEAIVSKVYNFDCEKSIFYMNMQKDSAVLNFYHNALQTKNGFTYKYRFYGETDSYYWNVVNPEVFCESSSLLPLGYHFPNDVNFLSIPYGKGHLYLFSNPLVFTNYFLTDPEKADYAASVFSHLSGKDIIWDEYSRIPFTGGDAPGTNPLYYILQQNTLKYAWWMMLASVILYILFAAKRTQRVIPVLEAKTNTSLEYIQMISALHYQNGNHLDMARKKMKYFLYFIRSKYGIQAQAFKEEQIARLAQKSKVDQKEVESIFRQYSLIEKNSYSNIDVNRLLDLYNAIENFYKQCK